MYKITIKGLDPHDVGHGYLGELVNKALEGATKGMTKEPIDLKGVVINVGWEDDCCQFSHFRALDHGPNVCTTSMPGIHHHHVNEDNPYEYITMLGFGKP